MSQATVTQGRDAASVRVRSAVTTPAALAGRKYAVELIGTFLFVFTVATAASFSGTLAPLAIGAALMVMIYAGGHISGGHYNPAVTLGALVRGRIGAGDAVAYWVAQLVGAVLAGLLVRWVIFPTHDVAKTLSGHSLGAAFVVELLFTFALVYVVLNVATSKDHPVNSFYGLAIGFTVFAGATAVGGISGGVFNPAVFFGAATAGLFAWSMIWVYLVAQLLGGIVAGLVFRALNPADR
ncbi:MAG: permease, glycerol uptake facilitator [Modestobacter sp.]|jgi:aquaporin Z|nr:permease, glycerol uptake facilitator [Modestobacter sp.]